MSITFRKGITQRPFDFDRAMEAIAEQPYALDYNFAADKTEIDRVSGTDKLTFARGSTGTYVDSDGLVKTAAINVPRFDHNPTTGESLGLLVEEARTNLVQASTFGSDGVSPDATLTAAKLVKPNGVAGSFRSISVSYANNTYTFSCYAKAAEWNWLALWVSNGTAAGATYFNLNSFAIGSALAGVTTRMEDAGNGWRRCSVTFTHSGTAGSELRIYSENSAGPHGNGDGTSGIYIWGAQLEVGSFPTSYIPTSGSAVTRQADVATITGAGINSIFSLPMDRATQPSPGGTITLATGATPISRVIGFATPLSQKQTNVARSFVNEINTFGVGT
jgi:hypothetical protein